LQAAGTSRRPFHCALSGGNTAARRIATYAFQEIIAIRPRRSTTGRDGTMRIFHFQSSDLIHPPREVEEFALRLVTRLTNYCGVERRAEQRYRLALPLLVMPLDENFESAGEGFPAVSRSISSKGICLFHLRPLETPYMAVQMADPEGRKLEAPVKILRCQKVQQFYEIAGTFVTKLANVPGANESSNAETVVL